MSKGEVLGPDYLEYQRQIAIVESASSAMAQTQSEYWWALWVIYRDNLWKSVTASGKFTDWLGDLAVAPYGVSRETFYNRIRNIQRWQALGIPDDKVQHLLGSRNETALHQDIDAWFEKNGQIKEEVAKQIEDGRETPAEFIERVSELAPGEARQEVQRLTVKDKVFCIPDDAVLNVEQGTLMFNVRWDNEEDGLRWLGTCRITGVQIAPESSGEMYCPELVLRFLAKALRLRL